MYSTNEIEDKICPLLLSNLGANQVQPTRAHSRALLYLTARPLLFHSFARYVGSGGELVAGRGRVITWVTGSFITSTSVTLPNWPKYSRSFSALVCQLSPPTNSLPGAGSLELPPLGVERPEEPPWLPPPPPPPPFSAPPSLLTIIGLAPTTPFTIPSIPS